MYAAPVEGGTNCEVFAFQNPGVIQAFEDGRKNLSDPELAAMMDTVSDSLTLRESGSLILTDDKAPVEVLGMRVLDEIIADELDYYRNLYLGKLFH